MTGKFHHLLKKADIMDEHNILILVIEDDPDVLDFILFALDEIGRNFEIKTAGDADSIAKALHELVPRILILDLMMPGTTGFIVCKNFREKPGTEKSKILAITGYDTPENRKRIIECGANDYLAKPFSLDALKEKINSFLSDT
ncbi:MAG: response regulator [bacterium]